MKLLLVDDSSFCVRRMRRTLSAWPVEHVLTVAGDGEEAAELLRLHDGGVPDIDVDLMMIDLQMPRMSGLELLELLRQSARIATTPVIVFTTSDSPYDKDWARKLDVAAFLVKDATQARILATLDQVLGNICNADTSGRANRPTFGQTGTRIDGEST